MTFTETPLRDALIIDPERHEDDRGFFARSFCEREFLEHGISLRAVQANISWNRRRHTLRGMHINAAPYEEAKVVSCTRGRIFDVIIDLRDDSPTCNRWTSVELTAENRRMLYIPKGFAHGFLTLEDDTEVHYLMSDFHAPGTARGVKWDDPFFGIQWPAQPSVISDKDREWPGFPVKK